MRKEQDLLNQYIIIQLEKGKGKGKEERGNWRWGALCSFWEWNGVQKMNRSATKCVGLCRNCGHAEVGKVC